MNEYWLNPSVHHTGDLKPAAYLIPNAKAGCCRNESPRFQLLSGSGLSAIMKAWKTLTGRMPDCRMT